MEATISTGHPRLIIGLFSLLDNTHPIWYKDAGLRRNVALGLGLCLVIATNVSFHFLLTYRFMGLITLAGMLVTVVAVLPLSAS